VEKETNPEQEGTRYERITPSCWRLGNCRCVRPCSAPMSSEGRKAAPPPIKVDGSDDMQVKSIGWCTVIHLGSNPWHILVFSNSQHDLKAGRANRTWSKEKRAEGFLTWADILIIPIPSCRAHYSPVSYRSPPTAPLAVVQCYHYPPPHPTSSLFKADFKTSKVLHRSRKPNQIT
jgi:hypothetical protein